MSQTGAMTEQATTLRRYEPTDAAAWVAEQRVELRGSVLANFRMRRGLGD